MRSTTLLGGLPEAMFTANVRQNSPGAVQKQCFAVKRLKLDVCLFRGLQNTRHYNGLCVCINISYDFFCFVGLQ